jgi:hypothetical protein
MGESLAMTARRRLTSLTAAACALMTLPAPSLAATTFGSRLDQDPVGSGECVSLGTTCTLVSFIHPSASNGDPYEGGAPVGGVITRFRIRAFVQGDTPVTVTFRLADITRNPLDTESALATAAGTGPSVTIPPTGGALSTPVHQFPARLPVTVGNHLAIDAASIRATVNVGGNFSYLFLPPLVAGEAARSSKSAAGELLVQADIEPDADGDGFGDETQDGCPSQSTTEAACDNKPPAVRRLRVAGTRVRYRLSEASTVRFQVQRAIPGRRVRGGCRRETRQNRSRPSCTRYVALGARFSGSGNAGPNRRSLPTRLGGRSLRSGRFRIVMTVRDDAGNGATKARKFRL